MLLEAVVGTLILPLRGQPRVGCGAHEDAEIIDAVFAKGDAGIRKRFGCDIQEDEFLVHRQLASSQT